jgi:hypothetical protein
MRKYRDPLALSQLWAVKWLSGSVFMSQLMFGALGAFAFSFGSTHTNVWMGGVLSLVPAFCLGLLLQHRMDPDKLSENKWTVWALGAIALILTGSAIAQLVTETGAG